MTKSEAIDKIMEMANGGNPGELTTGVCEALDISFDSFLKFSQLDEKGQKRVVQGLALALALEFGTEKFGHCSQ